MPGQDPVVQREQFGDIQSGQFRDGHGPCDGAQFGVQLVPILVTRMVHPDPHILTVDPFWQVIP
jgi:hypothetical protein